MAGRIVSVGLVCSAANRLGRSGEVRQNISDGWTGTAAPVAARRPGWRAGRPMARAGRSGLAAAGLRRRDGPKLMPATHRQTSATDSTARISSQRSGSVTPNPRHDYYIPTAHTHINCV